MPKIALYESERSSVPECFDYSWEDLKALLSAFREGEKSGPAWSPVDIEGPRKNANVRAVTFAVFDLDKRPDADVEALSAALERGGLSWALHSTRSHVPGRNCLRLVLPLSRPALPAEWPSVRQSAARLLYIDGIADPATKDLARLYFLPTRASGVKGFFAAEDGKPLDVDSLLAPRSLPSPGMPGNAELSRSGSAIGQAPRSEEAISLSPLRARLKGNPYGDRILSGLPMGEPGDRDNSLMRHAGAIAWLCPTDTSVDALLELCVPSLNALALEEGETRVEWFENMRAKLERAQEQKRVEDSKRQEFAEIARRRLRQEAKSETAVTTAQAGEIKDPGKYSEAELSQWAEEQGCSVEELLGRLLIRCGDSFYVFCDGRYLDEVPRSAIADSLHRDLARAPITLYREDASGADGPMISMPVLMRYHGKLARDVQRSVTEQRGHYDPRAQTLFLPLCKLRDLEPREDPEISEWLALLVKNGHDLLLDWIAGVYRLERQSAALHLWGPSGAGKTLLAYGLSRLWRPPGTGGPTSMYDAFETFNSSLAKCPLILADEGLPPFQGITARLRKMLSATSFTLRQKFIRAQEVQGCLRFMITANNNDLFGHLKESLGQADAEAISQRFLSLEATREAVAFLKQRQESGITQRWTEGDLIARHALWLASTRELKPARFIGTGLSGDIMSSVSLSGDKGLILEWLVNYLEDMKPKPSEFTERILVGEGELWVAPSVLLDGARWRKYQLRRNDDMTGVRLGKALKRIAIDETSIRPEHHGKRFYRVSPDFLFGAARNLLGTDESVKEILSKDNEFIRNAGYGKK